MTASVRVVAAAFVAGVGEVLGFAVAVPPPSIERPNAI
jgi:hypothetical protein